MYVYACRNRIEYNCTRILEQLCIVNIFCNVINLLSFSVIPSLCFLLHMFPLSEEDFEKLPASTVPEMQRTSLAPVILQLKALGIDNVLRFSFLSVSSSHCIHRVATTCSPTERGIVLYILISKNGPSLRLWGKMYRNPYNNAVFQTFKELMTRLYKYTRLSLNSVCINCIHWT